MGAWRNYDDVVSQLAAIGLEVAGPLKIGGSGPVRCRVEGDREKRGWYRLHELLLDGGDLLLVGSFGVWRGNDPGTQKVALRKDDKPSVTPEQMAAIKARLAKDQKQAEAERLRLADVASRRAANWWRQCTEQGSSAYLTRKGLPEGRLYGARISASGNLVIPMAGADSSVSGLQVIYADPKVKARKGRDKDFTPPGLITKGRWHQIGSPVSGAVVLLCEGFATGASLHEATGLPVAIAFFAGNLLPVAQAIAKRYRGARILVCADDDYLSTPNTGVQSAQAAALAVGGASVMPAFPVPRSDDKRNKGPTDFNDLHTLPEGGLAIVRSQVEAALALAGWDVPRRNVSAGNAPEGAGSEVQGRRAAVSIMSLDDIVERFLFVDDNTGEFIYDTWTRELCRRSKMINMLPRGVRGDDIKDHPVYKSRAVHIDQIGFDPAGTDPNVICNRWEGWPMQPKEGECACLLELLRYQSSLEANSAEVFQWMQRWLAYPLQNPGAKMHSAMVIHGPQGTGKSRFYEAYAKIFGDYAVVLNQGAIEDKFNSDWTERKLFVVADEIVARQDLYHLKNQLKNLITNEWVRVNPKNVAAHKERNHMNFVFLSNEHQPVQLENDDRRHLVLWTPPALAKDFYDELSQEINAGGIAALYHYLLNIDLGDFNVSTRPPMTQAKDDLVALGLSSEERFIRDWQGKELIYPFGPCDSIYLYKAYRLWCQDHGVARPRESNKFLNYVGKLPGWESKPLYRYDNTHYMRDLIRARMVIPAGSVPPEGKTKSQWLTDCHFGFVGAFDLRQVAA